VGNRVKDRWNRVFQAAGAGWAQWGPRTVSESWANGTIRGGFKRTFFTPGMAYSTTKIEVQKRGGRAPSTVTICELDQEGRVTRSRQQSFPKGRDIPSPRRTSVLNGDRTKVIAIVVDTPPSANTFQYRVKATNQPRRNNLGPVKGLADLHVHQMVDLAFGGRHYWGRHDGPPRTALKAEVMTTGAPRDYPATLPQVGIDANHIMKLASSKTTDEGFFATGGRGYPTYRDWPHHADRSHQQVHASWLHEAVKRNRREGQHLGLMVLSVVHNDTFCKFLKAFDPKGNVPNANGVGWASGPWGCYDDESVKRQIEAAHKMERKYDWYRIAMNPWHARQIVADGDLAVVISLETDKPLSAASGKYANWLSKLDEYRAMGLTSLQIVHESNSRFCGAALHRSMMQALQFSHAPVNSMLNAFRTAAATGGSRTSTFSVDANGRNTKGLTREGERLVDAMVQRNMPIDLAHGSVLCRKGVLQRVPRGYGLYDSHTKFERLLTPRPGQSDHAPHVREREKTFLITRDLETLYRRHKVLIGLRTASVDVYERANNQVPNNWPGTSKSFAHLVEYAHESGFLFAYGTDFNTGVSQLGPRFGPGRCWAANRLMEKDRSTRPYPSQESPPRPDARVRQIGEIAGANYYDDGLATIGWLPELTRDLITELRTPGAAKLTDGAEQFIQMWERAYDY
ncbi:MAG: membrane dipeptidase, partial [Pseudomonadota bacterium]